MQVPPTVRWIGQGVFAFTVLILTIYLAIFAVNSMHRRNAESLLRDVRTLKVGESKTEDVQRIMFRYGGGPTQGHSSFCDSADAAYGTSVGSRTLNRVGQAVPILRHLGLRPWTLGVMVLSEQGRVCFVSYQLFMNDSVGKWTWSFRSWALPAGKMETPNREHPGYSVRTQDLRDLRILWSEVTTQATEEERLHAFTFDLSCVTRVGGCKQRCEVAPFAWQDLYRESQKMQWALPTEETSDSRCAIH